MDALPEFPEEFSEKSARAVRLEELRAGQDFETAKQEARELIQVEALLRTYILRVFLAFAREGGDLVRQGVWSLDRLQREAPEFLRKLTIGASLEHGTDKHGARVSEMVSRWSGGLLEEVRCAFRQSRQWKEYEGLMIELAEAVETQPETVDSKQDSVPVDWEDIEITFLSDERVRVKIGDQNFTYNYAEMGFEDGRSGKPNQAWGVLRTLAQVGGVLPNSVRNSKEFTAVEKRIERLRSALREHFKIASDPVPLDSMKGYCCRFKVGCAPAFET